MSHRITRSVLNSDSGFFNDVVYFFHLSVIGSVVGNLNSLLHHIFQVFNGIADPTVPYPFKGIVLWLWLRW